MLYFLRIYAVLTFKGFQPLQDTLAAQLQTQTMDCNSGFIDSLCCKVMGNFAMTICLPLRKVH